MEPKRTNTELQTAEENALTAVEPFGGIVHDLGMVDRGQAELFGAIGRTKAPFQDVAHWPYLNELIRQKSRQVLEEVKDEETWRLAGGKYDDQGQPTFCSNSAHAAQVIHDLARNSQGFLWADGDNVWAVRLVPAPRLGEDAYAGIAFSRGTVGDIFDPQVRKVFETLFAEHQLRLGESGHSELQTLVKRLEKRLWLYERAEQLLWYIHAEVLRQRKSVVLIPDVALGQVVWGGDRSAWPKNWRHTLGEVLWSLSKVHAAVLHIGPNTWQPRFDMRSVAVATVEHLEKSRKRAAFCRPQCSLWEGGQSHDHYLIQIGVGFLGALEMFATLHQGAHRAYDFNQKGQGGIREARKRGEFIPVHLPSKIFGPSDWSGFGKGSLGVIQGLVREITRTRGNSTKDRELVVGGSVPGSGDQSVICPFLDKDTRYVSFNGNGTRRGMGYKLLGKKGHGWLYKCGYGTFKKDDKPIKEARNFFQALEELSRIMGLMVVGYDPRDGRWLDLKQLRELARPKHGWGSLERLHIRIYGPEDCFQRLRQHMAQQGGFSHIPGPTSETGSVVEGQVPDLRTRMSRAGVTQQELAAHLKVSPAFVSQVLSGKKSFTPEREEQALAFLTTRSGQGVEEGSESGEVDPESDERAPERLRSIDHGDGETSKLVSELVNLVTIGRVKLTKKSQLGGSS